MKHITLKTASGLTCIMEYSPVLAWSVRLTDAVMNGDHVQVVCSVKLLIVGSSIVSLADDAQVQKASDFIDAMESRGGAL